MSRKHPLKTGRKAMVRPDHYITKRETAVLKTAFSDFERPQGHQPRPAEDPATKDHPHVRGENSGLLRVWWIMAWCR